MSLNKSAVLGKVKYLNLTSSLLSLVIFSCLVSSCEKSSDTVVTKTDIKRPRTTLDPNTDTQNQGPLASESLSCIKSICGDENPFPHPFESTESDKEKAQSLMLVNQEISRSLKVLMGHHIHKNLIIDQMLKSETSKNNLILSDDQKGFYQLMSFLQKVMQKNSILTFDDKGELDYNEKELIKILEPNQIPYLETYKSTKSLLSTLSAYQRAFSQLPYQQLLGLLYKDKPLIEALSEEAKSIQETQKMLSEISPIDALKLKENIVLKKAINKEDLSLAEINYMSKLSLNKLNLQLSLALGNITEFSKIPLDLDKEYQNLLVKYQNSQQGKIFENKQTLKLNFENAVNRCSTTLSYSYSALPSQKQIDDFNKLLKSVLTKAKSLVETKKRSSVDESQFQFKINFPSSKETVFSDWKATLNVNQEETDLVINHLKTMASSKSALFMYLTFASKTDMFDEAFAFCDQTQPAFLNDAAIYSDKLIRLSWPTIKNPKIGIGIIAHEVGHMVSRGFSDVVDPIKNCLSSKYGKDQYAEEDFADLFSSEILNQFNYNIDGVKTENMACGLLGRNKDGWIPENLINSYKSDSHSSNFYRLISVATMTNSMTATCDSYLKKFSVKTFDNYCRW